MAKKISKLVIFDLPNNNYESLDDLTKAVAEIGQINRERDLMKSEIDDQISALQIRLQEQISPMDAKIHHIASGIKFYVDHHRKELFPDPEKRTCKLTTGDLKFRKIPVSVKTKSTAKLLVKIMSDAGLLEKFNKFAAQLSGVFLRVKVELNKEQILADPVNAKNKIGIDLNEESERLYIQPSETEVEIEAMVEAA